MIRLPAGQFLGQSRRRAAFADLVLMESDYDAHRVDPTHTHEHASVCLVLHGSFDASLHSRSYQCLPSTVLVSPADTTHAESFHGRGASCFIMEMGARWAAPFRDPIVAGPGPVSDLARHAYRELIDADDLSAMAVEGLILELQVAVERRRRRANAPAMVARAEEFMRAHFFSPIRLSDVAAAAEMHPARLATEFRRAHGCTAGDFVRRLRVAYAMDRLRTTSDAVAEIALAAGFCDQSHLTRVFKRLTGTTPAAVRTSSSN